MKFYIQLTIMLILISAHHASAQSTITGHVTGATGKGDLSGAYVSCRSEKKVIANTMTNEKGLFSFRNLQTGIYTIDIEYIGFIPYSVTVTLKKDQRLDLPVVVNEKSGQLSDVQVFGHISQEEETSARQKERHAANIVNVISARAMERSPDINAANVLQRMSGLAIQRNGGGDEAYPIVRGLDPRYSNTLINGIKITSPDDKARYVPLNIVPSDLLGSIEVHKSLLPEMEGDAIGGTVNMVMKDAPEKETFRILGSLGYSKIFIDRKFQTFSKADIRSKSPIEKYGSSYIAQPGDFSRSNLDFHPVAPAPSSVLESSYGRRFLHRKLGVQAAFNIQDQYYGSNSIFNQAAPDVHTGQPALSDYANRSFSTRELNSGLTLHLDYRLNAKNTFTLTNVLLYSYLAQSRIIIDTSIFGGNGGRTVAGTGPVSTDLTSVTNRQLLENVKLAGRHLLSKHFEADWAGVLSYAQKKTPDLADLALNKKIDTVHTTSDKNGPYIFQSTPNYFDAITRTWQHNEDKDYDALANLAYRTRLHGNAGLELKAGGLYRHKTRSNNQDQYVLQPTTNSNGGKQTFDNIYTAQWTVYNSSGTYDYDLNKYRLYENITAGYGQLRLTLPHVELAGGMRIEKTRQGYSLRTFYATGVNGVYKDYTDLLPSAMINYKLNEKTNLRASYYKAISRPNYYDLVPAPRLSASSATTTRGNPYLNHTVADNFDLRYEYYPGGDQQLFGGVFYKHLVNPIEFAYISGTTYEPQNFGNATDYGAELAFTKYFGHIGLTGNYTYLHSKIYSNKSYYNLSTGYSNPDTLQKRSLQGQTDHTLNLSLLYRSEYAGLFLQLSWQYIGKSIALVYPIYGYDYYQQPQSNLAFSGEKTLRNKHLTLFTKWNNLLNSPNTNKINNLLTVRDITKFNASFGLRYSN